MKITKQLWCVFLILILASAVSVVAQDPDTDGDGVEDAIDCAIQDPLFSVPQYTDRDNDGVRDSNLIAGCNNGEVQPGFTKNENGPDNCQNVANDNQLDTDRDGTGDTCENINQYQDLKDQFNSYEDDYRSLKRKYTNALDNNDDSGIRRYENSLDDLDDDLQDLGDDVDDLIQDIRNEPNEDDLQDKLENLNDDISDLQDKITDVLQSEDRYHDDRYYQVYDHQTIAPTAAMTAPVAALPARAQVTVEAYPYNPPTSTASVAASQSAGLSFDDLRSTMWLFAGIVILAGLIVFMVAVLLR
ncbi:MAG: hypothetical protein QT02_C0001G0047 [archaeon GW2011_AR9]|nr:MAG: hypothetical protein QT02_C0001G0047 [archaeon GW2011_AR9]MBS3120235.1 hypothetical protein [Candidatus Woesearchaeota archaeon]